jgi:hypothetical protein
VTICAPWFTVEEVQTDDGCGPCADPAVVDPAVLEEAIDAACEIVYELTDRDFPGVCTESVRPCGSNSRGAPLHHGLPLGEANSFVSYNWWHNNGWLCSCTPGRPCGCSHRHELDVGRSQLRSIESLTVDGTTYDSAASQAVARIEDWRYVVRIDGGSWPCCQDLNAALGDVDTFGVTFTYGGLPPVSIRRAAMILACQLALAYCGGDCDLPPNLTSLTRQGIQMAVVNLTQTVDGTIGLPAVDNAIAARRYSKHNRGAAIFSPDRGPKVRRVTWP